MTIGFSTGSLAYGDFEKAIRMLSQTSANAIELSALREHELFSLADSIEKYDLQQFEYISVHAPSVIKSLTESKLITNLQHLIKRIRELTDKNSPVVVHPDIINDYKAWNEMGDLLLIENMDKRKSTGQTTNSLEKIFDKLPCAGLCFDVGHARQVDPTMNEGMDILKSLGSKIREIHLSDVNSISGHERLNISTFIAIKQILHHIPNKVPVIIESLMIDAQPKQINQEMDIATFALCKNPYDSKDKDLQAFHKEVYGEPLDV